MQLRRNNTNNNHPTSPKSNPTPKADLITNQSNTTTKTDETTNQSRPDDQNRRDDKPIKTTTKTDLTTNNKDNQMDEQI